MLLWIGRIKLSGLLRSWCREAREEGGEGRGRRWRMCLNYFMFRINIPNITRVIPINCVTDIFSLKKK